MKSILMSIKPKWVVKILNKEKTLEIRKRFPKDYVGWVYIYCTKNNYENVFGRKQKIYFCDMRGKTESGFDFMTLTNNEDTEKFIKDNLNGKVVARFWCDKVEEHKDFDCVFPYSKLRCNKATCLGQEEIEDYGFVEGKGYVPLYAIHITKLEIFDKPKEIKEFSSKIEKTCICFNQFVAEGTRKIPLTKAPQSYCYIEI